jgi:uncharacterized protein
MNGMSQSVRQIQERAIPALRAHGVVRAAVFGSVARGDDRPGSDVDLLVDFEEGRGLLDLAGLRLDLIELLGRDADVITYASLHPRLKDRILDEQIQIYGA